QRDLLLTDTALCLLPELFRRLRKESWTVVLASSGKRQEVDHHKKLLQIDNLTDLEISSDEVQRSKPHSDILELVLEKLEGLPSRVLAVGDPHMISKVPLKCRFGLSPCCVGALPKNFWLPRERSLFFMALLSFCFDTRTGPISLERVEACSA